MERNILTATSDRSNSYHSTDFVLRLSDEENTHEIDDTVTAHNMSNSETDVIIISDSSSDSISEYSNGQQLLLSCERKDDIVLKDRTQIILSSSDSDSERKQFSCARQFKEKYNNDKLHVYSNMYLAQKNISRIIDESIDEVNTQTNYICSSESSNTHISPTPESRQNDITHFSSISKKVGSYEERQHLVDTSNTCSSTNCTSSGYHITKHKSIGNNCIIKQAPTSTPKLTKKDLHNIFKNMNSQKIVYTPQKQKDHVLSDESADEGGHPAISPKTKIRTEKLIQNNMILDETPSDVESISHISDVRDVKQYKPHNTEQLLASDIVEINTILSERKKSQITHWLSTNLQDSKCDSSFSHVSQSNRDSVSSGNSSLERLEMGYETPNNRGKVLKTYSIKKGDNLKNVDKGDESAKSQQTTPEKFLQKSKHIADCFTPEQYTQSLESPKQSYVNTQPQLTKVNSSKGTLQPLDCADILDKLYGKMWRSKADALLLSSERRQPKAIMKDRAVQTERKFVSRSIKYSDSSNDDNMKKLKTYRRKITKLDSFIDDGSLSDSESDSMYHTALTNPRRSQNIIHSEPISVPVNSRRAIAICDSDTDNDSITTTRNQDSDVNRRKLSFSENEDSSGTSEFDPGDYVFPKTATVKGSKKITNQLSNKNHKPETNLCKTPKLVGKQTFLASLGTVIPIQNAHELAKKYRTDFKNHKEELYKYLYKLYNEKVFDNKLPKDMQMEWNVRMRGTAGFCYNKKSIKSLGGVVRSSRIVLATKIVDSPDRLRDTLIHEMCHAAAWIINGVSDGHGAIWTAWANKAIQTFPELPRIRRCHDYKIKTKYTYRCTTCGYSIGRHSKSLDVEKKRCGYCYGKFEVLLNKTTKTGIVQMQTPKKEATGFALYVKENYHTIKKQRNIKHADVMKMLGQQFSALKIAKKNDIEKQTNTPASR